MKPLIHLLLCMGLAASLNAAEVDPNMPVPEPDPELIEEASSYYLQIADILLGNEKPSDEPIIEEIDGHWRLLVPGKEESFSVDFSFEPAVVTADPGVTVWEAQEIAKGSGRTYRLYIWNPDILGWKYPRRHTDLKPRSKNVRDAEKRLAESRLAMAKKVSDFFYGVQDLGFDVSLNMTHEDHFPKPMNYTVAAFEGKYSKPGTDFERKASYWVYVTPEKIFMVYVEGKRLNNDGHIRSDPYSDTAFFKSSTVFTTYESE